MLKVTMCNFFKTPQAIQAQGNSPERAHWQPLLAIPINSISAFRARQHKIDTGCDGKATEATGESHGSSQVLCSLAGLKQHTKQLWNSG